MVEPSFDVVDTVEMARQAAQSVADGQNTYARLYRDSQSSWVNVSPSGGKGLNEEAFIPLHDQGVALAPYFRVSFLTSANRVSIHSRRIGSPARSAR